MNQLDQSPEINKLAKLGDGWGQTPEEWMDYSAQGISAEHIPSLIEIVRATAEFWNEVEEESDSTWVPLHAWRALARLGATEAIPVLIEQLHLIDDDDNDILQEDMPHVFAVFGAPALPLLAGYLANRENPLFARISAADGIKHIAEAYPDTHAAAIDALTRALEGYASNDMTVNAFIIGYLADLKSIENAPLVEQAYQAGRVDESIFGDYEDFQVSVGLLERRLSPTRAQRLAPSLFADGFEAPPVRSRVDAATRKKRKEAAASRKKNRSKGKKKKKR